MKIFLQNENLSSSESDIQVGRCLQPSSSSGEDHSKQIKMRTKNYRQSVKIASLIMTFFFGRAYPCRHIKTRIIQTAERLPGNSVLGNKVTQENVL